MAKIFYVFLVICLFQTVYSGCADGSYATTPVYEPSKAQCSLCHPMCSTCSAMSSCITFLDKVKGVDRTTTPQTILCSSASLTGGTIGYNKNSDTCDRCVDGCLSCSIDYDICTECKQGWDFDRAGSKCVRATLGLAAAVLAVQGLTIIVVVITCIFAWKLWSSLKPFYFFNILLFNSYRA